MSDPRPREQMTPEESATLVERGICSVGRIEVAEVAAAHLRRLAALERAMDEFAAAYPEDVFTPFKEGETQGLSTREENLITRASAQMGRHVIVVLRRKMLEAPDA